MSDGLGHSHARGGAFALVVVAGFGVAQGCGSDDETGSSGARGGQDAGFPVGGTGGFPPPATGGAPTGTGATPATGGAATGGAAGAGGTGGSATTDSGPGVRPPATCEPHTGEPLVDPSLFAACDDPALPECIDGHCVPEAAVPAEALDLLADCASAGEKCVPRPFVETINEIEPVECTSLNGAEGRCLSLCIPQVAELGPFLPRDICSDAEKCAPCFDPRTGENTGACNQGCDGGPYKDPVLFDECCGGLGSCVPSSAVPSHQQSLLDADTCTGTDELCAPDELASTTFIPDTCRAGGDLEGRCLPACLPDIRARASLLSQGPCDAGELCAPCFDPINGEDTQACRQNGDVPAEAATTFPACCGGLGTCVPPEYLSDDQKSALATTGCSDGWFCAPNVFADANLRATTCTSVSGAEGRCLPPVCVPQVQQQASALPVDVCGTNELCAPCFDPITGADTTACSQNGDAPVNQAFTFPRCCSGIGVCVDPSFVPTSQQSFLGQDTCSGSDLCAPEAFALDPNLIPRSCTSFAPQDREGRCLPNCIPDVAARASQLFPEDCGPFELCAPCYDPVVGGSTGACEQNGDAPTQPDPGTFVVCQATGSFIGIPVLALGEGRCVPYTLVTPDQLAQLAPNATCQFNEVCAPCVEPGPPFGTGLPTGACPP